MKQIITIYLSILLSSCCARVDIEKYLKVCDRNSVDVNDCLVEAVQDGLEALANGIEDLGVPAVDPYHQKELRVEYKNNQIIAKMSMKDIFVYGLRGAKVHDTRLRADEDRFHMEIDMTSPKVFVTGQYEGEGRYNSLRINAHGTFNATMSDLVFTWKLDGIPETRDDKTYVRINSFYMRPDVGNIESYLTNNNPETRELTNLGNRFSNSNWRALYREFLPFAQDNWNKIGIRVANKIFLKVPYDQLFPANA
ncbi:protein takeout [Plodia interpunctella]|uniref:protein takeout n=1 Tax=Plodia interpunctella TaxID=58824 RepID=UPI00236887AD|nr:protein takeout-like [Plodia interpunctella]XP_053612577.1 protein takeout-like [Plodia interpunctella]